MQTGKKNLWKGHGKEKLQKRVVQLCTLTKVSSETGLLSVNWSIPEKKNGSWAHTFLEKNPWNF